MTEFQSPKKCPFPSFRHRITNPLPRAMTKIKGFYLSGQDITTGGWMPAVLSGVLVATQILGYTPLDPWQNLLEN